MHRRIGSFTVAGDLVRRQPESLLPVMARCVIVRAEFVFHEDAFRYDALCLDFDEVPLGEVVPHYKALVTADVNGDFSSLIWERAKC